jgi:hypothetical protein
LRKNGNGICQVVKNQVEIFLGFTASHGNGMILEEENSTPSDRTQLQLKKGEKQRQFCITINTRHLQTRFTAEPPRLALPQPA